MRNGTQKKLHQEWDLGHYFLNLEVRRLTSAAQDQITKRHKRHELQNSIYVTQNQLRVRLLMPVMITLCPSVLKFGQIEIVFIFYQYFKHKSGKINFKKF